MCVAVNFGNFPGAIAINECKINVFAPLLVQKIPTILGGLGDGGCNRLVHYKPMLEQMHVSKVIGPLTGVSWQNDKMDFVYPKW